MKLVMLTNTYPYGTQEAFIEPEMKILEHIFDEIHILSFASVGMPATRYIPANAKVTLVKQGKNTGKKDAIFSLLSPTAWKEMGFALKAFGYSLRTGAALLFHFYGVAPGMFMPYLEQEDRENTVFYSYWLSHLSYALTCFKKKHTDAFCISRAHRVDNFIDFKASLFRREIVSTLDGIYPISLEGKLELEKRVLPYVGGEHAEMKVFHLGVELPNIVNPPEKQQKMQIVSCSFIHKIKRLDILVNALSEIDDIPICWTHFGGGEDEEKIRQMAQEKLGCKENIVFDIRGQTAHDDILTYYTENHVDLFVNASDHEGIPVSIMEAMATGILCAARDVGGNRELLVNNENGFLLDENAGYKEYSLLFKQVYQMQSEKISAMKQQAVQKVMVDFASPAVYEKFANHLVQTFNKSISN